MPPRVWTAAIVLLAALPACTNDYENFRFPRQPSAVPPGPDGGTPPLSDAGIDGSPVDAAFNVTNG